MYCFNSNSAWLVKKENLTKQKEILMERYLFLYQNSPLILAYILCEKNDTSLAKTISERSGITIEDSEKYPKIKIGKDIEVNIFEVIEDFLLGDGNYSE